MAQAYQVRAYVVCARVGRCYRKSSATVIEPVVESLVVLQVGGSQTGRVDAGSHDLPAKASTTFGSVSLTGHKKPCAVEHRHKRLHGFVL